MRRTNQCPKCGSTDIVADANVITHPVAPRLELALGIYQKPGAILFKDEKGSSVSAWICGDCGFIEFYADSPATLKKAFAKRKARSA